MITGYLISLLIKFLLALAAGVLMLVIAAWLSLED